MIVNHREKGYEPCSMNLSFPNDIWLGMAGYGWIQIVFVYSRNSSFENLTGNLSDGDLLRGHLWTLRFFLNFLFG